MKTLMVVGFLLVIAYAVFFVVAMRYSHAKQRRERRKRETELHFVNPSKDNHQTSANLDKTRASDDKPL